MTQRNRTPMTIKAIARARVESALADLRYARTRVKEAREGLSVSYDARTQAVLDLVKESGLKVLGRPDLYLSWTGQTRIRLNVEVEGLKTNAIVALIALLDNTVQATASEDYATEWCAERTFIFEDANLQISLQCNIKSDSPTCKKVVVGTELKEVVKYAIACD